MRYVRTFFTAISLTLRGARPPEVAHAPLRAWIAQARKLLDGVYAAADANGLPASQRQTLRLRIDKREMAVETLLAALRHHLNEEYPYLLRHPTPHSLTAIYASNLNDRYYISRLAETLTTPALQRALQKLGAHLDAIPPGNS
ncbi:MAG: hypothetical protein HXY40_16715 [Chloroflexi bacterium]|nr:hypothetical protein [Chloroflexota bacterium]